MRIRIISVWALTAILLTSCVAKKDFVALQEDLKTTEDKLSLTKLELANCLEDKEASAQEIAYLKESNYKLLNNVGNLSTLSAKEAENLEKSLERLREKDLTISRLQDAVYKRDSVTLALVTSLKRSLGDVNDEDISVNVEKGVVFISIADKLLFKSGDYQVSKEAGAVLQKVATVIKAKPTFEVMVEGHTDTVPVIPSSPVIDNWDLSARRAASVVRILTDTYEVNPAQLIAAGRSYYQPIGDNRTEDGRRRNRRTQIVLLPKLDEFYNMVEQELKR